MSMRYIVFFIIALYFDAKGIEFSETKRAEINEEMKNYRGHPDPSVLLPLLLEYKK